jgi:CheY-like chemotaxis protein
VAKRVLLVDDSPIILAVGKHALTGAGFDVEVREGVEDLCEQGANGFDLILMDVQMPQLFGDDVAAILKHQRSIATPIYLYSTLPDEELRERAAEASLDGFVSKSAGPEHLVGEVRRILG